MSYHVSSCSTVIACRVFCHDMSCHGTHVTSCDAMSCVVSYHVSFAMSRVMSSQSLAPWRAKRQTSLRWSLQSPSFGRSSHPDTASLTIDVDPVEGRVFGATWPLIDGNEGIWIALFLRVDLFFAKVSFVDAMNLFSRNCRQAQVMLDDLVQAFTHACLGMRLRQSGTDVGGCRRTTLQAAFSNTCEKDTSPRIFFYR